MTIQSIRGAAPLLRGASSKFSSIFSNTNNITALRNATIGSCDPSKLAALRDSDVIDVPKKSLFKRSAEHVGSNLKNKEVQLNIKKGADKSADTLFTGLSNNLAEMGVPVSALSLLKIPALYDAIQSVKTKKDLATAATVLKQVSSTLNILFPASTLAAFTAAAGSNPNNFFTTSKAEKESQNAQGETSRLTQIVQDIKDPAMRIVGEAILKQTENQATLRNIEMLAYSASGALGVNKVLQLLVTPGAESLPGLTAAGFAAALLPTMIAVNTFATQKYNEYRGETLKEAFGQLQELDMVIKKHQKFTTDGSLLPPTPEALIEIKNLIASEPYEALRNYCREILTADVQSTGFDSEATTNLVPTNDMIVNGLWEGSEDMQANLMQELLTRYPSQIGSEFLKGLGEDGANLADQLFKKSAAKE